MGVGGECVERKKKEEGERGIPASSALGLQGVEWAFPVPAITGEVGRSKQLSGGGLVRFHLLIGSPSVPTWVHFPDLYQDWKTFRWKYSHFPEKEGEGNMPDGKPSHAYWNGIGKIFKEKEAATP